MIVSLRYRWGDRPLSSRPGPKPRPLEFIELVGMLARSGQTDREVAAELGLKLAAVRRMRRQAGVVRPRGGPCPWRAQPPPPQQQGTGEATGL